MVPRAQARGEVAEGGGGFLGDGFRGATGPEPFRRMKERVEQPEIVRRTDIRRGEAMNHFRRAGVVRVDLDNIGVADNEQRWILGFEEQNIPSPEGAKPFWQSNTDRVAPLQGLEKRGWDVTGGTPRRNRAKKSRQHPWCCF